MRGIHVAVGLAHGALALVAIAAAADAATFAVNTADDADDGACDVAHCSLREAILTANANEGQDRVRFDIPGEVPHEIVLGAALPGITDGVVIDALTEPGAPVDPWEPRDVVVVAADDRRTVFHVQASNSTLRGLGIVGGGAALSVRGPSGDPLENVTVAENFLGTADGMTPWGGGGLFFRQVDDLTIQHNLVLGRIASTPGLNERIEGFVLRENRLNVDRTGTHSLGGPVDAIDLVRVHGEVIDNILSSGDGDAIRIHRSTSAGAEFSDVTIRGNNIGVAVDGKTPLEALSRGIWIDPWSRAVVGGPDPGDGNVIANADLAINAEGRVLAQGNRIGTDATGTETLGRLSIGVLAGEGAVLDNVIGGAAVGIELRLSPTGSTKPVLVQGNRIGVGLDGSPVPNGVGVLARGGTTFQLGGESPEKANHLHFNEREGLKVAGPSSLDRVLLVNSFFQNGGAAIENIHATLIAPRVEAAAVVAGNTLLAGTLPSVAELADPRIDLYASPVCDPSGAGEGRAHLVTLKPAIGGERPTEFATILPHVDVEGFVVTAVASGIVSGERDFSEFSGCVHVRRVSASSDLGVTGLFTPPAAPVGTTTALLAAISNKGPTPARDTVIEGTLPEGFSVLELASTRGTCAETPDGFACSIKILPVGVDTIVRVELGTGGASVGDHVLPLEVHSAYDDPDTNRAMDVASVFLGPTVDLAASLADLRDPMRLDDVALLTATVRNRGPSDATDTRAVLTLDPSLGFLAVDPSKGHCEHEDGVVSCFLDRIKAGANETIALELEPSTIGTFITHLEIASDSREVAPGDETVEERTSVIALPDLVVNILDDTDDGACEPAHCSLREAIEGANERASPTIVGFELPGEPPFVLTLTAPLPPLDGPIVLDGRTQPNRVPGQPAIVLDGTDLGLAHGILVRGDGAGIHDLEVRAFEGNGIALFGNSAEVIGNHIYDNAGAGIAVLDGVGNTLRLNRLVANGGLGVDLGGDGVTANDHDEADKGPNGLQNFPIMVVRRGEIKGHLDSAVREDFVVDIYWTTACDPDRHGEALKHVDTLVVRTKGPLRNWFVLGPAAVPHGVFVVATATAPDGSTSEFSECVFHDTGPVPIPELTSLFLTGAGLLALVGIGWRRRISSRG